MDDVARKEPGPALPDQVLDSDDSVSRPTIGFRDHGIGVARNEAPSTILSIEGTNKLDKSYLHGVFGKGGSVACMYCAATVIISRKQPELLADGEPDLVTLVVVREDDSSDARLPYFRYLVSPEDELPYGVEFSETDFEPGTHVLHIGYHADRLTEQTWEKEESIYAFAETVLFRPTLPTNSLMLVPARPTFAPKSARSQAFCRVSASVSKRPGPAMACWRPAACRRSPFPASARSGSAGGCSRTSIDAGAAPPRVSSTCLSPAGRSTTPGIPSASASWSTAAVVWRSASWSKSMSRASPNRTRCGSSAPSASGC